MSTATHTSGGHVRRAPVVELAPSQARAQERAGARLDLTVVFAGTVLAYLLGVLPQVTRELSRWRTRAGAIPNASLRESAQAALAKRGNVEGAALFATLAPSGHRRAAVRALVAFQTAYSYLDALAELPSADPIANGERLHQALLAALHPGAPHVDYYAHNPDRDDGGYLTAILDACRDAVGALPSYPSLAPTARDAAARIVDFQALNLNEQQGGHDALQRWGTEATPSGSGLRWWEMAAACGSSLAVHALIGAAASPGLTVSRAREIDAAYFPWIGALHSLLDSFVDRGEDRRLHQTSLLDHYPSPTAAVLSLSALAKGARAAAERLPSPEAHRVIVTAMCSYYLSAPECDTPDGRTLTHALASALGVPLSVAIAMFRSKRLLHDVTDRGYS